jgi:hypothetical protein
MTVMTKELAPSADSYNPGDGLEDRWDHPFFADPDDLTAESYPHLRNVSPGLMFKRVVRALEPAPPEYVTLHTKRAAEVTDAVVLRRTQPHRLGKRVGAIAKSVQRSEHQRNVR